MHAPWVVARPDGVCKHAPYPLVAIGIIQSGYQKKLDKLRAAEQVTVNGAG